MQIENAISIVISWDTYLISYWFVYRILPNKCTGQAMPSPFVKMARNLSSLAFQQWSIITGHMAKPWNEKEWMYINKKLFHFQSKKSY